MTIPQFPRRPQKPIAELPATPRAVPPPVVYNNPAIPIIFDPIWRTYTDLTAEQIAAFAAMPENATQGTALSGQTVKT